MSTQDIHLSPVQPTQVTCPVCYGLIWVQPDGRLPEHSPPRGPWNVVQCAGSGKLLDDAIRLRFNPPPQVAR